MTSTKSFNIVTIVKMGQGPSQHSNSGWSWGPKENMCLRSTLEAQMIKLDHPDNRRKKKKGKGKQQEDQNQGNELEENL